MAKIRFYRNSDREALIDLLVACERFHQTPLPPKKQLRKVLRKLPPGVEILVAEDKKTLIGFASIGTLFPALAGKPQLYLKEIFIAPGHRGKSLGSQFFNVLIKLAAKRDCTRIDWSTHIENLPAQKFYKKLGATKTTNIFYSLQGKSLKSARHKSG